MRTTNPQKHMARGIMDLRGTVFTTKRLKYWHKWRHANVDTKCMKVRVMLGNFTTLYTHLFVNTIAIDTEILSNTAKAVLRFFEDPSLGPYFFIAKPVIAIAVVIITQCTK